jgi:cation diffusion facilitator CzcD-associated flavoprotein CzcO
MPSDFSHVPVQDDETSLDGPREAKAFLDKFSQAIETSDWGSFEGLFAEQCWWKDHLSLTFDKRTIQGRQAISSAWKSLAPQRKPYGFSVAGPGTEMVEIPPAFVRMTPEMATLDIPFAFSVSSPDCACVGVAKAIPSASGWKIWVLTTSVVSLKDHPFQTLPRAVTSNDLIIAEQRGKAAPQGLPHFDKALDAVVIGGGCSGLSNLIMLDSMGANVACFDLGSPGEAWRQRYRSVRLHHPNFMIQLPQYPVPKDINSAHLKGVELAEYMTRAVEDLKLPLFAGVKVTSNVFDKESRLWTVSLEDTRNGQNGTVRARNIIICNGFYFDEDCPVIPDALKDTGKFSGLVQYTTQFSTTEAYEGKKTVIVGSGNSAHDVAKYLGDNPAVKSVTMLQRSPTTVFDFDTFSPFITALYQGTIPVDTADFLFNQLPLGILRDWMGGAVAGLVASSEELYKKLEAKGYLIDRNPNFVERIYEDRVRSIYFDAPRTFDLVLRDRVKIAHGTVVGFAENGLIVNDPGTVALGIIEADAVVLATGYAKTDLPKRWAESGFLDAESASQIENVGVPGIDVEGEMIGQVTRSGRKCNLIHHCIPR